VLLFHKPTGVVTTKKDPEGRTTITHMLPDKYKHLHPIGRLDYDTSGILFSPMTGR
jgi:23S rRNA pseudouridine2605 synthase